MNRQKVDILIFGGGIAGLWTYNLLKEQGYQVALIEKHSLGGTQSLASQGMIHGGQRYTLQGKLNSHSESISEMPGIWQNCLVGKSNPDLSSAKVLSNTQYLWSPGGLTSNVTSFFASKAMNSRVDSLEKENWPEIFKASDKFKGKIYELNEVCLDIKTVINALCSKHPYNIYHADSIQYQVKDQKIDSVILNQEIELEAKLYVFTAGSGNEEIANLLNPDKKVTQRRPLKQILVKEIEYPLYAHCITIDPRPRVTISAHPLDNGNYVWYLGGLVAVKGLETSDEEAIAFAKKELIELLPWIDWNQKQWATLYIDRAEPYVSTGFLPDGASIKRYNNCILAWPTKLTFAPAVASKVLQEVSNLNVSNNQQTFTLPFSAPKNGKYPWEETKWLT